MSSGSVRLHIPVGMHQHEDPPGEDGREAIPDSRAEADAPPLCASGGRLWREDGRVLFQCGDGEPQAVRVVWARPLSGRGGPVSVLLAGRKREAAYFDSLDSLSGESRKVAEEELAAGMVLPRILAIREVRPRFGSYYWDAETDMGPRKFVMSSPENNHLRPADDCIVVRDVSGNCFEIAPVSELDAASQRELARVL